MKSAGKLIVFVLAFSALGASARAQSPREQLKQMVEELQKAPNNNVLRERIIKLGAEIKPAPAIPDEAIEFEGRAQFAFRSAKSEDDFLAAAREYEKAVAAAPWVAGYYSDLCTIYEKAGKFEDAKRHCEFCLLGVADSAQILDLKRQIAGLKYGIENSPKAKATRQREKDEALIRSLNGAKFVNEITFGSGIVVRQIYEIHGLEVHSYREVVSNASRERFQVREDRPWMRNPGDTDKPPAVDALKGREFAHSRWGFLEISQDGSKIRMLSPDAKEITSQNQTETRRVP